MVLKVEDEDLVPEEPIPLGGWENPGPSGGIDYRDHTPDGGDIFGFPIHVGDIFDLWGDLINVVIGGQQPTEPAVGIPDAGGGPVILPGAQLPSLVPTITVPTATGLPPATGGGTASPNQTNVPNVINTTPTETPVQIDPVTGNVWNEKIGGWVPPHQIQGLPGYPGGTPPIMGDEDNVDIFDTTGGIHEGLDAGDVINWIGSFFGGDGASTQPVTPTTPVSQPNTGQAPMNGIPPGYALKTVCGVTKLVKIRRRRRRPIVTDAELGQLAGLNAVLTPAERKVWLAKRA